MSEELKSMVSGGLVFIDVDHEIEEVISKEEHNRLLLIEHETNLLLMNNPELGGRLVDGIRSLIMGTHKSVRPKQVT